MLAVNRGVAKLFKFDKYSFLVTPIGLLMLNVSLFIFSSIMEMAKWGEVSIYYDIPLQVFIPIIIWIIAEIKSRKTEVSL